MMHAPLNRSAFRAQGRVRSCAACGRPLWQANAKKRFCSDRCRQAGHRSQKWDGEFGLLRSVGHHPSRVSRFAENSPVTSESCKANLADLAYSIIGPPEVIEIEIGQSRQLTPKVDRAEVDRLRAEIPADLSIPNFLRRRS
jgi:hypothetical protein